MTFKRLAAVFAIAVGMAGTVATPAAPQTPRQSTAIPTYDISLRRQALTSFCRRHPDDCAVPDNAKLIVRMTPAIRRQLQSVNSDINRAVTYSYDDIFYGRKDYWAYPDAGIGDCEDYALAKRRKLIAEGWPPSSLLIALSITETGEGHAVLIARTTDGHYVLDNRYDAVMPWQSLPYRWLSIQNPADPKTLRPIDNNRGLADILQLR